MNIPTYSANLNVASDRCSYFQDSTSSESATSCQAFFREVVEAVNIQCAMRTYETTKYNFQQPTVLFNNPFADPGFDKRSIVIVDSHTKEDQPLDLPIRIKSQNNHPPRYIPDNERFSIKSILGLGQSTSRSPSAVDIHYHPCEISNPLPNNHNGESLTTSHDKICTRSEKQKAYHKAYAKTEKRKAYLRAYQKAYQKAYRKTEKQKAARKAYQRSEKQKAYQKAYHKAYSKTEKRKAYQKAYQKAYAQSERGKAVRRAWRQSEKGKAYMKAVNKVCKNTGNKEQAQIAGKQAAAFIRESNKAKNGLDSSSISPHS